MGSLGNLGAKFSHSLILDLFYANWLKLFLDNSYLKCLVLVTLLCF